MSKWQLRLPFTHRFAAKIFRCWRLTLFICFIYCVYATYTLTICLADVCFLSILLLADTRERSLQVLSRLQVLIVVFVLYVLVFILCEIFSW